MYTIKDLQEGKVGINYKAEQNLDLLKKVLKLAFPEDDSTPTGFSDYYHRDGLAYNKWISNSRDTYPISCKLSKIELPFELPEKWCIMNTDECIGEWFSKYNTLVYKGHEYTGRNHGWLFHYPDVNRSHLSNKILEGYTEITLDQFKKYVLGEDFKRQATPPTQYSTPDLKVGDKITLHGIEHNVTTNICN